LTGTVHLHTHKNASFVWAGVVTFYRLFPAGGWTGSRGRSRALASQSSDEDWTGQLQSGTRAGQSSRRLGLSACSRQLGLGSAAVHLSSQSLLRWFLRFGFSVTSGEMADIAPMWFDSACLSLALHGCLIKIQSLVFLLRASEDG